MRIPDLTKGTLKPPLILFQHIGPSVSYHKGVAYHRRTWEIKLSLTEKYFPPKKHEATTELIMRNKNGMDEDISR